MEMGNYLLLSIKDCTKGNFGMTKWCNKGDEQIMGERKKKQNTRTTQGLIVFLISELETELIIESNT